MFSRHNRFFLLKILKIFLWLLFLWNIIFLVTCTDGKNDSRSSKSETDNLDKGAATPDRSLLHVSSSSTPASSVTSSPLDLVWHEENIPRCLFHCLHYEMCVMVSAVKLMNVYSMRHSVGYCCKSDMFTVYRCLLWLLL